MKVHKIKYLKFGILLDSSVFKIWRSVVQIAVQVQIFLLRIEFVNSTRHEIYRLNLNCRVRFHLIIIDLKFSLSKNNVKFIVGSNISANSRYENTININLIYNFNIKVCNVYFQSLTEKMPLWRLIRWWEDKYLKQMGVTLRTWIDSAQGKGLLENLCKCDIDLSGFENSVIYYYDYEVLFWELTRRNAYIKKFCKFYFTEYC